MQTGARSALEAQSETSWAQAFQRLHRLSQKEVFPDLAQRKALLRALRRLVVSRKEAFARAIHHDFGCRSPRETAMIEVLPVLQSIDDALWNVGRWMRARRKAVALHFLPASNRVVFQPKGLVLIVAPWNYPLELTIGPLVAALAAGNRVILKPSEYTPRFSELLKGTLEETLGSGIIHVATGGAEVAAGLTALPFDHILFTGSTAVGAKVMQAAAANLTPVTLELGGKSPAIVHQSFDLETAARRIARGKLMNAGQTCIAPDFVLAPAQVVDGFIERYVKVAEWFYPRIAANSDYTSIITDRHYDRLQRLVEDARTKGAQIRVVDPAREFPDGAFGARTSRKLAPIVLSRLSDSMDIMHEEIFGPILPVVPYTSLDEAVAYVNSRPRPLALYYFDHDKSRIDSILSRTAAGGVTINDTIFHAAQESLPFGGIGPSGIGAYHGEYGFHTFSHAKAVFKQGRFPGTELLNPPYGKRFDFMITALIKRFAGLK
jgi:acyl-CoA reductase-like NAD-dependent aldehyde dehydrogenase